MKKLVTSFITTTAAQRIKKGTLEHLQEAHQETAAALAQYASSPNYTTNTAYVLHGCKLTVVGSGAGSIHISAGAIFYNGEIFLVDTTILNPTTGMTPYRVVYIDESYVLDQAHDPVDFTDLSTHNVHQVRKAAIQNSALPNIPSTAICIFEDLVRLLPPQTKIDADAVADPTLEVLKFENNNNRFYIAFSGTLTISADIPSVSNITACPAVGAKVQMYINCTSPTSIALQPPADTRFILKETVLSIALDSVTSLTGNNLLYFEFEYLGRWGSQHQVSISIFNPTQTT